MSRLLFLVMLASSGSCMSVGAARWVDVQGARIHVRVTGPRSAPAVILNAGAGQDLSVWSEVEEELSEFARVVTCLQRYHVAAQKAQ